MFVDLAKIKVSAGRGGDGAVAFHREKYVAAGGPDGGDGGKGGDIVLVGDSNLSTLLEFRYRKNYRAGDGQNGQGNRKSGRGGENLVLRLPLGTLVRDAASGRVLADLSSPEPVVVAKGGRGGWGNCHFSTATRQLPRFAKPGLDGEAYELSLELKLLADVGLVGFPNVGKSTLISAVSAARPKIAAYPFTTLVPVLGVVRLGVSESFVMADIPGLIEGASEGVGLGHRFLRHVERCRLIVHVLDAAALEGRDPLEDFALINRELQHFSPELAERPQLVCANKADIATPEQLERLRAGIEAQGYRFFVLSAAAHQGTDALIEAIGAMLPTLPPLRTYEPEAAPLPAIGEQNAFTLRRADDAAYVIEAPWLRRILDSVNFEEYDSLLYLQKALRTSGILDALEEAGIEEGDTVRIFELEFDYVP